MAWWAETQVGPAVPKGLLIVHTNRFGETFNFEGTISCSHTPHHGSNNRTTSTGATVHGQGITISVQTDMASQAQQTNLHYANVCIQLPLCTSPHSNLISTAELFSLLTHVSSAPSVTTVVEFLLFQTNFSPTPSFLTSAFRPVQYTKLAVRV